MNPWIVALGVGVLLLGLGVAFAGFGVAQHGIVVVSDDVARPVGVQVASVVSETGRQTGELIGSVDKLVTLFTYNVWTTIANGVMTLLVLGAVVWRNTIAKKNEDRIVSAQMQAVDYQRRRVEMLESERSEKKKRKKSRSRK